MQMPQTNGDMMKLTVEELNELLKVVCEECRKICYGLGKPDEWKMWSNRSVKLRIELLKRAGL
jgi:hypothetical protein